MTLSLFGAIRRWAGRVRRSVVSLVHGPDLGARLGDLSAQVGQQTTQAVAAEAEASRYTVAHEGNKTRDAVTHEGNKTREFLAGHVYNHVVHEANKTRDLFGQRIHEVVTHEAEKNRGAVADLAERVQGATAHLAERAQGAAADEASRTREEVTRQADRVADAVAREGAQSRDFLAGHVQNQVTHHADRVRDEAVHQGNRAVEAAVHQGNRAVEAVVHEGNKVREQLAGEVHQAAAAARELRDTIAGWQIDAWKIRELEGLLRYQRRRTYLADIAEGRLTVPRLTTDHPLAVDSNDTLHPRGSKNDNSISLRFNRKLYQLFGNRPGLRVLDIGCAGGGLVRSLLDDGHFAVGLDGSDYPLVNQTGEWHTIPRHLFTCDATMPFTLTDDATGEGLLFDAVTAWELMEHIPEDKVPGLMANIARHLAPGGRVLLSIATFVDWDEQTGVVWHVTVKPPDWWAEKFRSVGFEPVTDHPFSKNDWLRGSNLCQFDWHEDQGLGFHMVLRRAADDPAGG